MGIKKIWTVSDADDVVLLLNNEVGITEMIREFRKYMKERDLELKTGKTRHERQQIRRKEELDWK